MGNENSGLIHIIYVMTFNVRPSYLEKAVNTCLALVKVVQTKRSEINELLFLVPHPTTNVCTKKKKKEKQGSAPVSQTSPVVVDVTLTSESRSHDRSKNASCGHESHILEL